ncbi:hypothetical protein I307_00112 [Cryptococcus deuterogattii 99/473]|uniref:Uncharacterized protein n=2 Tax=Cryptococcus deuterogattii TaxID=1859096 RepID=A0A0D0VG56_9TREE|nr:hypothetical protein CNBG_3061 [Cryptococcus deuterogattii R265]KIR43845.1 hypothetical protein I313_00691 [Cryptococcus deuterogattii Ram5]KIR75177.1 hypothetical protein I310_01455 [Cryptococcus deuterogattii CA1014]KIR98168.1 hypothetical protein L804_04630 [Cryptococcus deuterogattii 2001/935-1]KIY60313.1 hypothetical protein I307_00112 [Cryptococcus deuterogattii 99/473]
MSSKTPEAVAFDTPEQQSEQQPAQGDGQPMIDPSLMEIATQPAIVEQQSPKADAAPSHQQAPETHDEHLHTASVDDRDFIFSEPHTLGITESIAQAPDPKPGDFMPPRLGDDEGIDLEALESQVDDDMPGSPTAKLMRAIAPPLALQSQPIWPAPPPNSSVNLFIGRALLSNGNDNWPLKPNDIVNWIRKHYPSEWDGDEGRCSAHRVRTYLARKGADMYYEKLNQGCIAGWRIRQNHLWRFENGGFQGRGMKQEEAIANAQKESEAIATAARKAAAAEALAAGHPNVKVSMSQPGVSDGMPSLKRPRVKQPLRRRPIKTRDLPAHLGMDALGHPDQYAFNPSPHHHDVHEPQTLYSTLDQAAAGPSTSTSASSHAQHTPTDHEHALQQLHEQHQAEHHHEHHDHHADTLSFEGLTSGNESSVDINMVQQAMQAAAGQMDDLEMGMQLPIEMQMHSTEHDDDVEQREYDFGPGAFGTGQGYTYNG